MEDPTMKHAVVLFIVTALAFGCQASKKPVNPATAGKAPAVAAKPAKKAAKHDVKAPAASEAGLTIEKLAIAPQIENREPVNPGTDFSADVGRLYCYTKVVGAKGEVSIKHLWHFNDKKVDEITLAVKSANFRTRSSKLINPKQTGQWRVDVTDEAGKMLDSISFTIH